MKPFHWIFTACLAAFPLFAQQETRTDAESMVKKAIAYYKANGKEKAIATINIPKGPLTKGEVYVFVYDLSGNVVAHGGNPKLVGKNLIDAKDPDGVFYVKERINLVKAKKHGWQDYKFPNPQSGKIEAKTAYVEIADDLIFGAGIYK